MSLRDQAVPAGQRAYGRATLRIDYGTGTVERYTGNLSGLHMHWGLPGDDTGWAHRLVWRGEPSRALLAETGTVTDYRATEEALYERAEDAAAAGLPMADAVQAVRDGYSSVAADRAVAADEADQDNYQEGPPMLGVDVSRWQGDIDWQALREDRPDIRFAYVRAGGGKGGAPPTWQHRADPYSVNNATDARFAGLAVGGYVAINPPGSTPEEAAVESLTYLTSAGLLEPGCLVPALDIEDTTRDWSAWAAELLTVWRQLTRRSCGGRVIVYSSASFFDTYLRAAFDRTDPQIGAWVAHWNQTPGQTKYTLGGRAVLHQYTSKGTLPGVTGDIDMNATMPGVRLADWMIEA